MTEGLVPFRKLAFTLAEVLITLGIIGIVAAMTLPAVVSKYKDKELATRAQKTYSAISQAIKLYQAKNNTPGDSTGLWDVTKTSGEVTESFVKYFNGAKLCLNKNQKGCAPFYGYKVKYNSLWVNEDGSGSDTSLPNERIILSDGSVIAINQKTSCEMQYHQVQQDEYGNIIKDSDGNPLYFDYIMYACAAIYFDTNGPKLPNQFGRDVFRVNGTLSDIQIHNWSKMGSDSLKSILSGGEISYTDYTVGEKFEF